MGYTCRAGGLAAALLVASSVSAGVIFVPVGNLYTDVRQALVTVSNPPGATAPVRLLTEGLSGEANVRAVDIPEQLGAFTPGCATLPLAQDIELELDPASGAVDGRTRGVLRTDSSPAARTWHFRADVTGRARCLPAAGLRCGQMIFDLEARGVLFEPADTTSAGLIRMQMLGSLARTTGAARWDALTASMSLGGDARLVQAIADDVVAEVICPL